MYYPVSDLDSGECIPFNCFYTRSNLCEIKLTKAEVKNRDAAFPRMLRRVFQKYAGLQLCVVYKGELSPSIFAATFLSFRNEYTMRNLGQ